MVTLPLEGTLKYLTNNKSINLWCKWCESILTICWPLLFPQIIGATVGDPLIWNISVQFPAVGWAVANEIKSKLKIYKEDYFTSFFFPSIDNLPKLAYFAFRVSIRVELNCQATGRRGANGRTRRLPISVLQIGSTATGCNCHILYKHMKNNILSYAN